MCEVKRSAWDITEGGNFCLSTKMVLSAIPLLSFVGFFLRTIPVLATFLQEKYG